MTEITSKEGNTIKIFVHPEQAFEQFKRDYQDAYDAIRERFGLWPINKMNMDQYVTYGWQCSVYISNVTMFLSFQGYIEIAIIINR